MNAVLDALRADPNLDPALVAAFDKIDPRRFAAEPVPHSALAPLDDEPEGECDVCQRIGVLALCDVTGIETYACERCRGEA